MSRLFGTDGIRGVANSELTPELAFAVGEALAGLRPSDPDNPFLLGRDTRLSGPLLEAAFSAGVAAAGGHLLLLGIFTTPGVAIVTWKKQCPGGIAISASHNPPEFNGIKLLGRDGFKMPDEIEREIEEKVFRGERGPRPTGAQVGFITGDGGEMAEAYMEFLLTSVKGKRLPRRRVCFDCAYGATARFSPMVAAYLGLEAIVVNGTPEGERINVDSGSLHPAFLQKVVREQGAAAGFAFDGDGDRVVAVDEEGRVLDGDALLWILARYLHRKGTLSGKAVVGTVMTNMGLERALGSLGIGLLRVPVGDRFVASALREKGLSLGGEPAGHIIFLDLAPTGDGLLTALQVLAVMGEEGVSLSELASGLELLPQRTVSVPVRHKDGFPGERVEAEIRRAESLLGDRGRVVVRPSGTEPLIRVTVEGEDEEEVSRLARELASRIEEELS